MRGILTSVSVLVLVYIAATVFPLLQSAPDASAVTRTWTGLDGDSQWSTPENWSGNIVPVAGDDLVFPESASQKENNNDLAANTSFNSISFTGPAGRYDITGNAIRLTNGITADLSDFNDVDLDITLNGSQTSAVTGPVSGKPAVPSSYPDIRDLVCGDNNGADGRSTRC